MSEKIFYWVPLVIVCGVFATVAALIAHGSLEFDRSAIEACAPHAVVVQNRPKRLVVCDVDGVAEIRKVP